MKTPATLLADFYKVSHREQYPKGTEYVYSTWTPRFGHYAPNKGAGGVVAFGFQGFIREWLMGYFHDEFFTMPLSKVVKDYDRVLRHTLGLSDVDTSHLEALHGLGFLPLRIKAVPEGTIVPLRVPMLTVENTLPEFFWLTNYIETLMSAHIWQPSTSASIAHEYRKLFDHYAKLTGGDPGFVQFQGHDFSYRGMGGTHAAAASGAGHLLSFVGTDTIPAILHAEEYYDADITTELVGTSIPATEHSVMCAHGVDNEQEAYRRLIQDVYPNGMVSIVSDTWDLWAVLTDIIAPLRNAIMDRDGKVVIRPDSGDPVDIICGDPTASEGSPAYKGVVEVLWDTFGGFYTDQGYKQLDSHIGVIYGDAITYERGAEICARLAAKGFASTNMVYGIGSFTYQHVTRDTYGFALKSTWCQVDGEERFIFKDPATDANKSKKSLTGRVAVVNATPGHPDGQSLVAIDGLTKADEAMTANNLLTDLFVDGRLVRRDSFGAIRSRLADQR